MAKRNTRKQFKKSNAGVLRLAKTNPYRDHPNSEYSKAWVKLKEGIFELDEMALMDKNGIVNVMRFFKTCGVVANPLHPDNNWRSIVEKLVFGKDVYYRLATEIPIAVMDYWKSHGHPLACGWNIFDPKASSAGEVSVLEDLEKASPSTPVAKKAFAKIIPAKVSDAKASRPVFPRHPKNPFRPGTDYGVLVDILATVGANGTDKDSLLEKHCRIAGKDLRLARYDFQVIASAQRGKPRHQSCRKGFFILKQGDIYSIEFE